MEIKLLSRLVLGMILFAATIFLPAGTWHFWSGWFFCTVYFIFCISVSIYLKIKDPALLDRRMKTHEPEKEQRIIIAGLKVVLFAGYLTPGFDYRFGWSSMPKSAVITANLLVVIGYVVCFWAFKANTYAARTVEVEKGQKVIDTGPYAYVRHPMYSGVILVALASGPALGSLWGLIPFILVPVILILRIRNEEMILHRQLAGYDNYCHKVRWRIVPGLW